MGSQSLCAGSMSQLIVAHDPTGRPAMIRAKYSFTSPATSGRSQGSVKVSFIDEMPNCIFFSDTGISTALIAR